MNFRGTIKDVGEVKEGTLKSGTQWANIEFVVEEQKDQYPQVGVFKQMKTGENVKYIHGFANQYPIGTVVDVEFNLKGSEYKGKYYANLDAWKITKVEGNFTGVTNANVANPAIPVEQDEDLPF